MIKKRTLTQNGAIHVGFTAIARALNESGKDMRLVLKPSVDIYWSGKTVKEYLYKPILKAYANKDSTADMDKLEPGKVWDIMMKYLGENHEVEYIAFPSREYESEHFESRKLADENAKLDTEDYQEPKF